MSRRSLERLAALVWIGVGLMLLVRGGRMLVAHGEAGGSPWGWLVGGVLLGAAKGRFVLSRSAARNRARIAALESPRPWQVFAPRFWPLIAVMMGFGFGLRSLAEGGVLGWGLVGGLYAGIGAALLASSRAYFGALPVPIDTSIPADFEPATPPRGLLVVNLGTPDAPTAPAVRRYLREFLGDPRVVRLPRPLWWTILNLFVLPKRSPRSAEAYRKVWGERGSPLMFHTADTAAGLAERLGPRWKVVTAMRYGHPSIAHGIELLAAEGVREVTILPLFPQWSDTTCGTSLVEVARVLGSRRDGPAPRMIPPFPADEACLAAMAAIAREEVGDTAIDRWVFSFHGVPERYVRDGDPYLEQCQETAVGLARHLGLERGQWEVVFQSRFGKEPWLTPAADERVPELAREGVGSVAVLTPGFACDCLETIEEIGMELADEFREAGGTTFIRVPCPNADPRWVAALARLVEAAPAAAPEASRGESPEPLVAAKAARA
jgi:ferrochelatase